MIRAFQWDLARQVERLDWLLSQLPRYAAWGYTEVYLHLEDAVEYPSLPGVARGDAYRYAELERLVREASRHGIGVVPIVNLLGHTQYLIQHPEWRDLNELRQPDGSPAERGQICPLHPRTLEVAAKLIGDMAPFCTAGKLHVGLDESFHLGKHPLSRSEIADIGLAGHFARYVGRLHQIVSGYGLQMGLWADMLALLPEAIPQLPRGLAAYDWYYYPFPRLPRMELHNFAEYDLAPALARAGIDYWGCPMNGAFRFEPLPIFADRLDNIRSWWKRVQATNARGMLITSWESYRLAQELCAVVDASAASLWLDRDDPDNVACLSRGFRRAFACPSDVADHAARACLQADHAPFAGYARWERNERWDTVAPREGTQRSEHEALLLRRLARKKDHPAPLVSSLGFRAYLAERDWFVRRAVRGVLTLRRLHQRQGSGSAFRQALLDLRAEGKRFHLHLQQARADTQAMWNATRDPQRPGQNHRSLDADTQRWEQWMDWLGRIGRHPALVHEVTPVLGPWQLQFTVWNFAPAVQRIVVETQTASGTWEILHSRYTIEFRAEAARPRSRLRREFSVPIVRPELPLRIALRGLGQVRIGHVTLTNGRAIERPANWPAAERRLLGSPAPTAGFPNWEPDRNNDTLSLHFTRLTVTHAPSGSLSRQ